MSSSVSCRSAATIVSSSKPKFDAIIATDVACETSNPRPAFSPLEAVSFEHRDDRELNPG